ncbi:MAG: ATP phosphoribosyltransferase regulatory subunit [Lachnospiraceae bacterium]|nr:ATP phosphoribosyltransferase regulatory subunit [Lachnospiraceae bacterium]
MEQNSKKLLHTPEGVRDYYTKEYAEKQAVEERMTDILHRYGYRGIQTPTFEFFDVFSKEKGSVSSREMFKFIDRDGETLVLRPDITPAVARCAAKYFREEDLPLRVCYCGSTFVNHTGYQGRLREQTQLGAELIGDETTDSEAEMIAMMADCLLAAGLTEFQIELGNINFFQGLVEEAGLSDDQRLELRQYMEDKNLFAAEDCLRQWGVSESLQRTLTGMIELFGDTSCLAKARTLTQNPTCLAALDRLEKVYHILELYGKAQYVTFDLGLVGKYEYYTGVIFRAFTYGTGASIINGGRYDRLLAQYGKNAAAIGFGISMDALLSGMRSQKLNLKGMMSDVILLYDRKRRTEAITVAAKYRADGRQIQMMKWYREKSLEDYKQYALHHGFSEIWYLPANGELQFWKEDI